MKKIEHYSWDEAMSTRSIDKMNDVIDVVNELVDISQSSYVKWDIGSPGTWQGANSDSVIMEDKQEPNSECGHDWGAYSLSGSWKGWRFCPLCGEKLV